MYFFSFNSGFREISVKYWAGLDLMDSASQHKRAKKLPRILVKTHIPGLRVFISKKNLRDDAVAAARTLLSSSVLF